MVTTATWPLGSSMVLQLDKLRNSLSPGYLNAATVTATVRDAVTEVVLSGEIWPVTLGYVSGSDGRYRVTTSYAVALTYGQRLAIDYSVVNGALRHEWREYAQVIRDC